MIDCLKRYKSSVGVVTSQKKCSTSSCLKFCIADKRDNTGLESLSRFWSVSPGLMSFREKALVSTEKLANPSEVQSEPHLPSDVVLGQLVTERIGLEKGIVLSFSS